MIEVSVIIVYRNEERYIIDCIRSIEEQFEQSSIAWELILVANCPHAAEISAPRLSLTKAI